MQNMKSLSLIVKKLNAKATDRHTNRQNQNSMSRSFDPGYKNNKRPEITTLGSVVFRSFT